jgi:glutamyl-Q tRNA(Asp) synthetase
LDARAHGGRWLLRVEDLDKPREIAGATDGILKTLSEFGFEWDGEVIRQSDRLQTYCDAIEELRSRSLVFACTCSRQQLEDEQRYPGTCRAHAVRGTGPNATRLKVDPGYITFNDRIQGMFRQDVAAAVGDVILCRRDQIFAYLLAVVVDDAEQGITHIVRGADLLDNTPRQIYVQRQLRLPQPRYAHVPVLMEENDHKLSKSRRSVRVDAKAPLPQLLSVFSLLGLNPPNHTEFSAAHDAWSWAIANWNINKVAKCLKLSVKG